MNIRKALLLAALPVALTLTSCAHDDHGPALAMESHGGDAHHHAAHQEGVKWTPKTGQ